MGQASPYGSIEVHTQATHDEIPGFVEALGRLPTFTARADADGRFTVPVNLGDLPAGSDVTFSVVGITPDGRRGDPVVLMVERR